MLIIPKTNTAFFPLVTQQISGSQTMTDENIEVVDQDETADADAESPLGWKASVSLEFDVAPVLTWRGQIDALQPHTAMSRAVRAAKKQFPRKHPRSWVCVLERL